MEEWCYVFDDKENTVDDFIIKWMMIIKILISQNKKTQVTLDITKTTVFSITKITKIISFISSNKKQLKEATTKIKILTSTEKQEKVIKNALFLSPVRICEFEIIKNVVDV